MIDVERALPVRPWLMFAYFLCLHPGNVRRSTIHDRPHRRSRHRRCESHQPTLLLILRTSHMLTTTPLLLNPLDPLPRAPHQIGGGGLFSMVHICVSDVVSLRQRGVRDRLHVHSADASSDAVQFLANIVTRRHDHVQKYHGILSAINGLGTASCPSFTQRKGSRC